MATANDGISRFSDSTVYGQPTFEKGLALGGSTNITLGDGTVAPTAGQLGYFSFTNMSAEALASGVGQTTATFTLPAGTYIIIADYGFQLTAATVEQIIGAIFVNGSLQSVQQVVPTGTALISEPVYNNMSIVVKFAVPTIIRFDQTAFFSAGSVDTIASVGVTELNAVRLA